MPYYVIKGQHILFAHVPKCGGTSIEGALRYYGAEALYDVEFHKNPDRFSNCSAQHLHRRAIERLFPRGFFDFDFAMVRHPVERLVSEFKFRRSLGKRAVRATRPAELGPEPQEFGAWIDEVLSLSGQFPYLYDNHVRPQVDFLAETTRVFRLEDGLQAPFRVLSDWIGFEILAPIQAKHVSKPLAVQVSAQTQQKLRAFYAEDFERFGYTL